MDSKADSEKLINAGDLQAWDENDDDDPTAEPGSAPYESPAPKSESFCQKMRRLVVIEPYYMLFTVGGYPSYSLREQYFYYAVGQSMNIDTNNLSGNVNETCGDSTLNDTSNTDRNAVQQRAAELNMYIELAVFLPYIISMLLYGTYSDKLGRKLLFILPPIGACIDVAIQMCIIYFKLPVYVFFAASIGTILCGSSSLVFIAIYSYIADTVPPHGRATRMIIIDVIGKFLGGFVQLGIGYWIKESYFWPYCFVGGCYILSIIYAIFFIPETVQRDPMAKFSIRDIGRAFQLYTKDNGTRRRWKLWVLTLSLMVEILFLMAFSVFTLFEMNAPLCWNSVMIGYYGAARDTVEAVGGVVGMFFKRCMADHWMALLGKVTFTTELLYLAFVQSTLMMYFVPLISFFGILSMPVHRTMMSNLVEQDEQGALFSMLHCMMALVMLFSGTAGKKIYSATLPWWSGFVFLLSAIGGFLASLLLVYYIARLARERRGNPHNALINEEQEERKEEDT